jgi:thiol-disulfide isomerase/thioredoxin
MKLKYFVIISLLLSNIFSLTGQIKPMPTLRLNKIQENRTETNCEGISQNIYELLKEGRPLMIMYDGFDCGNCKKIAPKVGKFMEFNFKSISFWAPLMYRGDQITCNENKKWEEWFPGYKYSFGFPARNSYYHDYYGTTFNLPFIIVIDQKTKKVAFSAGNDNYEGGIEEAFENACNVALSLVKPSEKINLNLLPEYKIIKQEIVKPDSGIEAVIDIINQTDTSKYFKWQIDYSGQPSAWLTVLCDPAGCKAPGLTDAGFRIKPGDKSHFHFIFYTRGTTGIGDIKLEVFPAGSQPQAKKSIVTVISYLAGKPDSSDYFKSVLQAENKLKITITDEKNNEIAVLADDMLHNYPAEILVIENGILKVNGTVFKHNFKSDIKYFMNYYINNSLIKSDELPVLKNKN